MSKAFAGMSMLIGCTLLFSALATPGEQYLQSGFGGIFIGAGVMMLWGEW